MCNACGNVCCGSDMFSGCGCDGCDCEDCWPDDEEFEGDDDFDLEYGPGEHDCVTSQDRTPPDLKLVLAAALARQKEQYG